MLPYTRLKQNNMKIEGTYSHNWTPKLYCDGCKKKCQNENIFVEYSSLIKELKKRNNVQNGVILNENITMDCLESSSDSDDEIQILLKNRQPNKEINPSEKHDRLSLEIEVLKCENLRLNKEIEDTKLAKTSMDDFYSEGFFMLAMRRLPALYLTLTIELIGGLIISYFNDVIRKYTLLVSFMPALSAISGMIIKVSIDNKHRINIQRWPNYINI